MKRRVAILLGLPAVVIGCVLHGGSSVPSVKQLGRTCKPPTTDHAPIMFEQVAMVEICNEVYVEPKTTAVERQKLRQAYDRAVQRNIDFFGSLAAGNPVTVFCATDLCRVHFTGTTMRPMHLVPGGRAEGASFTAERPTIIINDLGLAAEKMLAHEMAHVELRFRVSRAFLPQWFNEGLATLIADAPDCWMDSPKGVEDLRTLDGNQKWVYHTDVPRDSLSTYCQARNEVKAWVGKYGKAHLLSVLKALKRGKPFYDLYGPMPVWRGEDDADTRDD